MTRFDQDQLDELRSRTPLSTIFSEFGYRVRGSRGVGFCLCPWHAEKSPSCKVNDNLGQYHCFGCGEAGDHFSAVMYFAGIGFVQAVERLGGVHEVTDEDRRRIAEKRIKIEREEREERERALSAAERMFERAKPIANTHAAAYLSARGLTVVPRWTFDLRYAASLPYRGFRDGDDVEGDVLGEFPAMLAAIRDQSDTLIGVHRTYLDPEKPKKLVPPGDLKRNRPKKIMGEVKGGMIRLSQIAPHLVMGEGIETSQAYAALGRAKSGWAVAAAVSLGNLSGRCTGSLPHPKDAKKRIPNGDPDMDAPGVILPDVVKSVTLLMDGDSDPAMTAARLLAAGRRFRTLGREVDVDPAPAGKDFNDLLMEASD